MIKRGYSFEFEVPDDWEQFKNGSKLVLHGPDNQEIIISEWTVRGSGLESEFLTIRERILQNAFDSINAVTADAVLVITTPLHHQEITSGLDRWSVSTKTSDDNVLFEASIFRSIVGVLMVTLEAPNKDDNRTVYDKLIKSMKRVDPYENHEEFSV